MWTDLCFIDFLFFYKYNMNSRINPSYPINLLMLT